MNVTYANALANYGGTLMTQIALTNAQGVELSGGNPVYTRRAVTWTAAVGGTIHPQEDLIFNIPPNTTVAHWVVLGADGVTVYGGGDLTPETYAGQGEYKLVAATSAINHTTS